MEAERTKAYSKADEIGRERDEALESASKLRNKISEIIKEKMKSENDSSVKYQSMEND
jgi:hypothetical protein